jgi:hypothetical protein
MPAPASDREVPPAGVPDGITPHAGHLARREVSGRARHQAHSPPAPQVAMRLFRQPPHARDDPLSDPGRRA